MSESNLFSWAGSQPIWIQVFIGLVLFFFGLPLLVYLAAELFFVIGDSLAAVKVKFSQEAKAQRLPTTPEPDQFSDEVLFQALCHSFNGRRTTAQIEAYLSNKTSAEKSALKKNPKVLRALAEMKNEAIGPSYKPPCLPL